MTVFSSQRPECDLANRSAEQFIRRLSWRYFLVLGAVAGLVIVDQAIVQPLLVRMNSYAPAINLAGRQRMLSQRIAKAALALQVADDEAVRRNRRDELSTTLLQWSSAHTALRHGDPALGIPRFESMELESAWNDLEPHFQAMLTAARTLAADPAEARAGESRSHESNEIAGAASRIVDHEADFLSVMERIVLLLQHDAQRQVVLLRTVGLSIALTVMTLLIVLGWLVVRPATSALRTQVDRLEVQVVQRTQELAQSNAALRDEMQERQEAEAKNHLLANQLAHAARVSAMGHLTAAMAHEINQPLATITNYAETCDVALSKNPPPATGRLREHIELIKESALRAGQIVRRIRNFVRPGSRTPLVEVELNEIISEVVELCRFEAHRDRVHLTLRLSAQRAVVRVDPIQIQQVLVNLVQNAIQALNACPAEQRRLRIATDVDQHAVRVEVCDSGPGFDPLISAPFAPFATTKTDGLGIGLSICRSIVEEHGGRIWVDTGLPEGTALCFTLPLVPQQNANCSQQADCLCGG